ncbi:MAG: anthranilate phosphoribosyltransferase [Candidatus Muproteobacteria bacterium RBG_16_65_34]|uniref:Anthranilate phosphoribosyltransferase n=1 Tax=Candidatus Muproteobacteria bacterium RBG_16_65_34 TaxID=1817760 RepID=A0A1F6TP08_9PROT|nr:MAG: anthranilate phosphoribosyltransferase [Candidatus Muproteobacteria bacterium RBG_16_65_34]
MSRPAPTASSEPAAFMRSILQRIATGPELSKDISREEAHAGMRLVLDGEVDPVQAGIFLIALRMKRETDDENLGMLDALREAARIVTAPVDEVIDIADPYDGYNRTLPATPFLPAVLAACGVAAVSHGVERMGPKYGVTHRQILAAAGLPVDLSVEEAAARLGEPGIGWAYVDQKAFCPKLHNLATLRTLIVKRPAITTAEVAIGPIRGRSKTHLVTGYVHKPYPRIYALLARAAGFDSALIVRGVEGGVVPSLRQTGKVFYYHDRGAEESREFDPADLGIRQPVRAAPIPGAGPKEEGEGEEAAAVFDSTAAAKAAAEAGLDALAGKPGPTRDALVYAGALCLWHLKRYDVLPAAADAVRQALDSGQALARVRR